MSSPATTWDRVAGLALGCYGAAFGAWKLQEGNTVRWESIALSLAGVGFLVMALALTASLVYRLPVSARLRETIRLWRRERARQEDINRWQTAAKLEVRYRNARLRLEPLFSLTSPVASPTWTVLRVDRLEVEIVNRYTRAVAIDRLWAGVFSRATGKELPRLEERSSLMIDGDRHIGARGVQRYGVTATLFFSGLIRCDEVEVFIVVEDFGLGCQRVRVDESLYS